MKGSSDMSEETGLEDGASVRVDGGGGGNETSIYDGCGKRRRPAVETLVVETLRLVRRIESVRVLKQFCGPCGQAFFVDSEKEGAT